MTKWRNVLGMGTESQIMNHMEGTKMTGMTEIFNDLRKNKKDASRAKIRFVAVALKKDGTPRKIMANDLVWCGFTTKEAADNKAVELRILNPGREFTVVNH